MLFTERQIKDTGNQLNAAILELQEAMGGTWLGAAEEAIASIRAATEGRWGSRRHRLEMRWLRWIPGLPPRLEYWLTRHWPRRWLPRLEGDEGR